MKADIGLYIHIPFCRKKCPYCDFYSFPECGDMSQYEKSVISAMRGWAEQGEITADTVYFGGGTPSVLGGEAIARIALEARRLFNVPENAEITAECNPSSASYEFFRAAADGGVNRISMGLQSALQNERTALGRSSSSKDAFEAAELARKCGIDNISLDLMLGIPKQTMASIERSVDFCAEAGAKHISAYMLKIEEGTPFHARRENLNLPDDDEVSEMYLHACSLLAEKGFGQYEISNFALPGFESRHNLKYWDCSEYLGIGPSAHSFLNGKRFFYKADLSDFVAGGAPVPDGDGGGFEEYAMLRLRLTQGLTQSGCLEKFGFRIPDEMLKRAAELKEHGLVRLENNAISLTEKGFLLSNSVICRIIFG